MRIFSRVSQRKLWQIFKTSMTATYFVEKIILNLDSDKWSLVWIYRCPQDKIINYSYKLLPYGTLYNQIAYYIQTLMEDKRVTNMGKIKLLF